MHERGVSIFQALFQFYMKYKIIILLYEYDIFLFITSAIFLSAMSYFALTTSLLSLCIMMIFLIVLNIKSPRALRISSMILVICPYFWVIVFTFMEYINIFVIK